MVLVSKKNGGQKRSNVAPTITTFCTVASGGKRKASSLQPSIHAAVQRMRQSDTQHNNHARLQMTTGKLME
jgi:hypothetical protein